MTPRRVSKYRRCGRVLMTAALALTATPVIGQDAAPTSAVAGATASGPRDVQAIRVDESIHDGQTTWIIKPDVPRIPRIQGLDASLPPHIESRLRYAFDLAQRGATYSAHAEFRGVLEMCALELDAREGGSKHRQALLEGWTALSEADDFAGTDGEGRVLTDVRPIAARHSTRLLRDVSAVAVDPIKASQTYYAFAEQRLVDACGEMPASTLAFYGLGRTCAAPKSRVTHAAGKAALLHRVALNVAPQNMLAANELGVLLAQHGHLEQAQEVFKMCVARQPTPEAWRNLSAVYARRGDLEASRKAAASGDALAAANERDNAIATNAATPGTAEIAEEDKAEPRKPGVFQNLSSKLPAILRR